MSVEFFSDSNCICSLVGVNLRVDQLLFGTSLISSSDDEMDVKL